MESMDCGQPIRFMQQAASRGAANFRFFADKPPRLAMPALHQMRTPTTQRTPIGRGVITPWNTPFMLATWKSHRPWRRDARGAQARELSPLTQ